MKVQARENGFVQTIFGRKRYLKDINSRNATVRGFAERNAINAPIQGSAADIIKMAMINVAKALKENNLESKMILQVHDELVFDCPVGEVEKVKAIVRVQMENVTRLSVPLTVECNDGENWLQAH
jgi:DNA polymerase-1